MARTLASFKRSIRQRHQHRVLGPVSSSEHLDPIRVQRPHRHHRQRRLSAAPSSTMLGTPAPVRIFSTTRDGARHAVPPRPTPLTVEPRENRLLPGTSRWAMGASIPRPPRCEHDSRAALDHSRHVRPRPTTLDTANVSRVVAFRPTEPHRTRPPRWYRPVQVSGRENAAARRGWSVTREAPHVGREWEENLVVYGPRRGYGGTPGPTAKGTFASNAGSPSSAPCVGRRGGGHEPDGEPRWFGRSPRCGGRPGRSL